MLICESTQAKEDKKLKPFFVCCNCTDKMSTTIITPQQILDDRANRKNAGLTGCITGRPDPGLDFFGFRDVQIWFMDANGNLNGHPDFNRKNPMCFCFDCRGAFDPRGEVDAELVNEGHANARHTYRSLLPNEPLPDVIQVATVPAGDASPPGGEPSGGLLTAATAAAGATPGFSNTA